MEPDQAVKQQVDRIAAMAEREAISALNVVRFNRVRPRATIHPAIVAALQLVLAGTPRGS